MAFSVEYNPDRDYMLSTITGKLNKKLISEIFTDIGIVAAEYECKRILCNSCDTVLNVSIGDIYSAVKILESTRISRTLKRTVVISRKSEEYLFWETVCSNRGYGHMKIFQDYDEAVPWLTQT